MTSEVRTWLQLFCHRRDLSRPDGRWLYRYQTTKEEFEELRSLLTSLGAAQGALHCQHHVGGFPAGFALYAADWWKREYAGSHWSWNPILESLSIAPASWPRVEQQSCLVRGLHYWGQTPRTAGKAYLGAIASQAGLPMRVVSENSGTIADLLGRVLRKSARLGLKGEDVVTVVRQDPYGLPESLRLDQTIALVATMVDVVLDLRREYKLAKSAHPVAELDRRNPDWRKAFPLLIEDSAAKRLLEGLVRDAAQVALVDSTRGITIRRTLRQELGGSWCMTSAAAIPSNLSCQLLEKWLGISAREIPRLLFLEVSAGDVYPIATAVALPGLEDRGYHVERHPASWSGSSAIGTHRLSMRASSRAPNNIPLVGGEALDPELPWVFVKGDQEWLFVAEGSAQANAKVVMIAVPSGATLSGSCTIAGTEATYGLQLVEVSSMVTITTKAGDTYRVTPAVAGAEQEDLVWEGLRCWEQTTPELVFRGRPRLASYDQDGERRLIRASELDWMWKDGAEQLGYGTASIAWRLDGIVQRRWTVVLVPEKAAVVLKPESLDAGGVFFEHFRFKAGACENLESEITDAADDTLHLRIPSGLAEKSAIRISLWWNNPGSAITFTMPSPVRGVQVVTTDGVLPGLSVRILQRNLYGSRLRLTESSLHRQGLYAVTIGTKVTGTGHRWATKADIAFRNGTVEYRLLDFSEMVEEILAGSEDLDAQADIEVTVAGHVEKLIQIGRSEVVLERGVDTLSAPVALEPIAVDLSAPILSAFPLPMQLDTVSRQYVANLAILMGSAGPWFVASREGTLPAARPTVIDFRAIGDVTENQTVNSLRDAICVRDVKARNSAIVDRIAILVADGGHEDWAQVGLFIDVLGHVPLASFDLWRAIPRSPAFAVSILSHLWESESIGRAAVSLAKRLGSELPFLWEAVPAADWKSAFGSMFKSLTTQLSEDVAKQVFTALAKDQFSVLPTSLRMLGTFYLTRLVPPELIDSADLGVIRDAMALGRTPFKAVLPRLKGRPESLFQGVIQRRHESQWPVTDDLRNALLAVLHRTGITYKDVVSLLGELVRDTPSYQQATLLLPVALAIGSASNTLDGFLSNSALVRSARILRNFDRIYFEDAYRMTFGACMAAGLHVNYQWTQ